MVTQYVGAATFGRFISWMCSGAATELTGGRKKRSTRHVARFVRKAHNPRSRTDGEELTRERGREGTAFFHGAGRSYLCRGLLGRRGKPANRTRQAATPPP